MEIRDDIEIPPNGPGIELETLFLWSLSVPQHKTPGQGFNITHLINFSHIFVLEKSGKFQISYRLATEQSHLDIPGYNEMTLTKMLKMATLVRAKKAGIKQTVIVIIVTGKTPNYKFQICSSPEKLAAARRRQDSHFSANFLHVHFATKRDFIPL